jgi:signal transduction histidine kinase
MIVLFSVIIAVALASSPQGPLFGSAMASLYGGVGFLLGGYANQVQKAETARQNTERLLVDLQSAHRQLQGYVSLAEEMAAEQERSRLAHELHDCVTQTVFSMNLTVQSTRLLLDRDPGRAEEQLVRLEELATGALREIRTLVYHLQPANGARGDPSAFASHDLPEALHRLASERQSQDRLRVSVEVNGSRSLTSRVSAGLTAIAREALINVARHAGTGEASIRLDLAHRGAYLEIEDHGSGFDPAVGFAVSGHFGLAGMADRAKEIDWDLFVDTGPGLGTRIRVAERQSGAQGERFDKP